MKISIKKSLPKLLRFMIFVLILVLIPINMIFQLYVLHKQQSESSKQLFAQVEQIVNINEKDLEEEKEQYSKQCIRTAEMVAYFINSEPEIISDLEKTKELAQKLDVDEIHYFNTEGVIYAGTHPEYYGYTFDSGEQMRFFAPMLEDTELKLCQDITPNTAEGKEMQYAAVWLEDKSGIVQIGMRPERLLTKIEEIKLEHVIASIPFDIDGDFHIVDINKNEIIASSVSDYVGNKIEFPNQNEEISDELTSIHMNFKGVKYCIYTQKYNDYLFVRMYTSQYLVNNMMVSSIFFLISILLAVICIVGVFIWYINKYILNNLILLNEELNRIEDGDLEELKLVTRISEFDHLIYYINQLLKSIRFNSGRISNIIDSGQIPLGVFEYNEFYKKAFVNKWMIEILGIELENDLSQKQLKALVDERLKYIEDDCVDQEEKVYRYYRDGKEIYVRLQKNSDNQSTIYYLMDVSSWWAEINSARDESNKDILTGLFNRRGLQENFKRLFANPTELKKAAIIMLDADGLKRINDLYGHHIGDEYLKIFSSIIKAFPEDHSICARLGGDEFVVLLYGYETYGEINEGIEELKKSRGKKFFCAQLDKEESIEFSIGYSYYPVDDQNYQRLMSIADERMYQEKRQRKAITPKS